MTRRRARDGDATRRDDDDAVVVKARQMGD